MRHLVVLREYGIDGDGLVKPRQFQLTIYLLQGSGLAICADASKRSDKADAVAIKSGVPRGHGNGETNERGRRSVCNAQRTAIGRTADAAPSSCSRERIQRLPVTTTTLRLLVLTVMKRHLREIVDNKLGKGREEVIQRGIGPGELTVDPEGDPPSGRKRAPILIHARKEEA